MKPHPYPECVECLDRQIADGVEIERQASPASDKKELHELLDELLKRRMEERENADN